VIVDVKSGFPASEVIESYGNKVCTPAQANKSTPNCSNASELMHSELPSESGGSNDERHPFVQIDGHQQELDRSIDDQQAIYRNACPAKARKMRSSANLHLLQFTGLADGTLRKSGRWQMSILAKAKIVVPSLSNPVTFRRDRFSDVQAQDYTTGLAGVC